MTGKPPAKSPAKYGSRGETCIRISKPLRDRLNVVTAHERLTQAEWIGMRVMEREEHYGITPPDANLCILQGEYPFHNGKKPCDGCGGAKPEKRKCW